MDTARTINKKGAKNVFVVYRRAREQMPAEAVEVEEAMNEGIMFLFQNNIVKVVGDDKVKGIECIKTELIKVDGDRERPVNIEGSNHFVETDYVVMAVGSRPDSEVLSKLGLELNDWGYIKVDEIYETSRDFVFASGDLIRRESNCRLGCKVRQGSGKTNI